MIKMMSLVDSYESDVTPFRTDHINSSENIVTNYSEVLKNKPIMERQHTNMTPLFLREVNPFKGNHFVDTGHIKFYNHKIKSEACS